MPTALRASRDFVAQALARVRSGLSRYEEELGKPGQEIKVEPFDAQNVSTSAGLIKLGTSIAAARRRKANLEEAQKDVALEREKNRAEIARIRAQEKYYLGEGRQAAGAARLESDVGPYKAGTLVSDVSAGQAQERIGASARSAAARNRRIGRVTAAQAGLKQIDAQAARDIQSRATSDLSTWAPTFAAAARGNEVALQRLGIDPEEFNRSSDEFGAPSAAQKQQMLAAARQRVLAGITRRNSIAVQNYFTPQRKQFQSIIDQAAQGFDGDGDELNIEQDIDPLGLE